MIEAAPEVDRVEESVDLESVGKSNFQLLQGTLVKLIQEGLFELKLQCMELQPSLTNLIKHDPVSRSMEVMQFHIAVLNYKPDEPKTKDRLVDLMKLELPLLKDLALDEALTVNPDTIDTYYQFIESQAKLYKFRDLDLRKEGLHVCHMFLSQYFDYLRSQNEKWFQIAKENKFVPQLVKDLLEVSMEVEENQREEAAQMLLEICENMIFEHECLVMQSESMKSELDRFRLHFKDLIDKPSEAQVLINTAEQEASQCPYVFEDCDTVVADLVKIVIDEPKQLVRDVLQQVMADLYRKFPFVFLDSYRKAINSNSLGRQNLLKSIVNV